MSVNPDEDTEFNDALRKLGILPPKQAPPPSPSPPPSPTLEDELNEFTINELLELSEDAPDDETERIIALHRQQRIAEERKEQSRSRFGGDVHPIGRDDYTREVTEASQIDEEDDDNEKGTGVICFLYKDGLPRSDRAFEHIRALAKRYTRTKFVSIVGDKCIPNLPDSRVPMFIVYRKGDIQQQIVAWGADRERRLEELEAVLLVTGALDLPDRLGPSQKTKRDQEDEDDLEDEDGDPSSRMRSAATSVNARHQRNIRSSQKKKGDDSDSDFEFDM